MAISRDHIFFGCSDKRVYSLNAIDGSINWTYETEGKIWSSPVITRNDGILYVGSLDSHLYGLEIETGKLIWKFPTMNAIESSPCIVKDMLFISSKDGLCIVLVVKNDIEVKKSFIFLTFNNLIKS